MEYIEFEFFIGIFIENIFMNSTVLLQLLAHVK